MESQEQLLDEARDILQRARRTPAPAELVKMRAALEEKMARRKSPNLGFRWAVAGVGMAACAVAIFLLQREPPRQIEVLAGQVIRSDQAFALSQGTILRAGRATIHAVSDAQIELPRLSPDQMRLDLFEGSIDLSLEARTAMIVATPLAEIRAMATSFSVAAESERTDVRVAAGAVEVRDLANGRVVRVGEGETHSVLRAAVAAADRVEIREAVVGPIEGRESAVASGDGRSSSMEKGASARRAPPRRKPRSASIEQATAVDRLGEEPHAKSAEEARAKIVEEARSNIAEQPVADPTPAIPPAPPRSPAQGPRAREAPPPKLEPAIVERFEELLRRADQARRAGKPKLAASLYAEVAAHPEGGPFAEEALFRKAELHAGLGQAQDCLQALGEAERRFGRGELAPERSALAARVHLDEDDPIAASRALSGVTRDRATLEVSMVALDAAAALEEDHPCDALRVLSLVGRPEELRARAQDLVKRIGTRCPKSP